MFHCVHLPHFMDLSCFLLLAIVTTVAMNMSVQISPGVLLSLAQLLKVPQMDLLIHMTQRYRCSPARKSKKQKDISLKLCLAFIISVLCFS